MASISKLQAALSSVTNEVTLAAANINFDFTLVKYEAPKEFHQLGNSLSKLRVHNAEYGPIHITARRLGALFDGLSPPTPCLLKSYGSRVSEIALAVRDTSTPEPEESAFSAYHGVDGTSIWAAATSSCSALHMQLLACMLARVWSASEATSIWYELVNSRRDEIEKKWKNNEVLPFAFLTAAVQSPITRANLAEWDASARAWLRTADRIKTKEQDQLMLLMRNLNVPMDTDRLKKVFAYESVITAWTSALASVEKLVRGEPQAVDSGASLLALFSWHLYPDVVITSPASAEHHFNDPLVSAGGTLTLGLAPPGGSCHRAVFWSLPLAHLNYYGRPVRREAELDMQSKAITFEQFVFVVFGALLWQWGFRHPDVKIPALFFKSLRCTINKTTLGASDLQDPSSGLSILCKASEQYLDAYHDKEDAIHKLIALGSKKATKFTAESEMRPTFFNMETPTVIFRALKGTNERISFLRRIASSAVLPREAYYIRYFADPNVQGRLDWNPQRSCGITTAFDEKDHNYFHHIGVAVSSSRNHRWAPEEWNYKKSPLASSEPHRSMLPKTSRFLATNEKYFTLFGDINASSQAGQDKGTRLYIFVYGQPGSAALFLDTSYLPGTHHNIQTHQTPSPDEVTGIASSYKPREAIVEDLIWGLDRDMFVPELLANSLNLKLNSGLPQVQLLFCLSTAHRIYRAIPKATLTTRALNRPMQRTKWSVQASRQFLESPRDSVQKVHKTTALSCVAYMETGMDIDPSHFARVFAIAYEDSIYVSMQVSRHFTCCFSQLGRLQQL